MSKKKVTYQLEITEDLLDAIQDLIYELSYDHQGKTLNDFFVSAAVAKFNMSNKGIFAGKIDANGDWT